MQHCSWVGRLIHPQTLLDGAHVAFTAMLGYPWYMLGYEAHFRWLGLPTGCSGNLAAVSHVVSRWVTSTSLASIPGSPQALKLTDMSLMCVSFN